MVHYLLASKSMMWKKTKQTTTYIFLKRVTPRHEESQARPTGRIPEEGIIIIGDDSSMQIIGPEDVPVRQDVGVEDRNIDDTDHV
jgi:hypothetical protein